MPSALYMNVHLPIALTEALLHRGLDNLTSQDDGRATSDDKRLLARAADPGHILLSKDQDFLRTAATWQQQSRPSPGVLFAARPRRSSRRLDGHPSLLRTRRTREPAHLSALGIDQRPTPDKAASPMRIPPSPCVIMPMHRPCDPSTTASSTMSSTAETTEPQCSSTRETTRR
jgi:hypothetical protein